MPTVIEPTSNDDGWPTKTVRASALAKGDVVTNMGVIDAIESVGVFVVTAIRGTVWSLATGRGDVHILDVVWHESQSVTIDR